MVTNENIIRTVKKNPPKMTKKIDTKVDDAYPVKKLHDILRLEPGKPRSKDGVDRNTLNCFPSSACTVKARNQDKPSGAANEHNMDTICPETSHKTSHSEPEKLDSCTQNKFCHVAELSFGGDRFTGSSHIDMDVALKGFAAIKPPNPPHPLTDSVGRFTHKSSFESDGFRHEVCISGDKAPLDFTVKSNMRLISSASVSWFHRLSSCGPSGRAVPSLSSLESKKIKVSSEDASHYTDVSQNFTSLYCEALCSWLYPQSSLPSSVVSAMTISAAHGGSVERDFLTKRQLDWEDSFRSLYYMLRRSACDIFYVYTSQFIAMFIAGDMGPSKHTCNAYLSRSTRGLRALLKENDVEFTMPLCRSEVENPTSEDLQELSEFERRNPGQTCHQDYMYNVDNSFESLLAFVGNKNVHGLYDFLLNYRSFLNSLTSLDVPILYSPVAFQNASIHSPQVRCKQMKRADAVLARGFDHAPREGDPSCSLCYSIEIRDSILLPWLICRVCKAMRSDGRTFEASFTVDPLSSGLNVALDHICSNASGDGSSEKKIITFMDGLVDASLKSASVQGLKYKDGSYVATILPD